MILPAQLPYKISCLDNKFYFKETIFEVGQMNTKLKMKSGNTFRAIPVKYLMGGGVEDFFVTIVSRL